MGVGLGAALDKLRSKATVRLERRPAKYMFGCLNYGELPGYRNDADGDPWDIFAPGYEGTLPHTTYTCTGVLGVLLLENGNHKIGVTIDHAGYDEARARAEIRRYCRSYCRRTRVCGRWANLRV